MQYHAEHADMLYLVSVHHRAQRSQQDLHQSQVVVASSHMQTCVTRLKAQEPVQSLLYHVGELSARRHAGGLTLFLVFGVDPPSSRRRAVWACAFWHARWSAVFPACINTTLWVQLYNGLSFELLVRTVAECNSTFRYSAVTDCPHCWDPESCWIKMYM